MILHAATCFPLLLILFFSGPAVARRSHRNSHFASSWEEVQQTRQEAANRLGYVESNALWPLPQQFTSTGKLLLIPEDFVFFVKGSSCDMLEAALQRYYKAVFGNAVQHKDPKTERNVKRKKDMPVLSKLYVMTNTPCSDGDMPDVGMDEHYEIDVRDTTFPSILVGNTIWGVIRGLETFSQLVWKLGDGRLVVNQSQIVDWPRFGHRGLLLDTSRHFISKETIRANLDAMAMNKYNVFHWHIVDDQSFPYQSRTFPGLSTLGAWEPHHHVYTQQDVAEVIEFARVRGIRVIAEFDTPGHSLSWGFALRKLLTPCFMNGTADGTFGPVNPILNSTYDTLTEFFTEVFQVFPDTYVHLGGDEVDFSCWKSNPDVNAFMKKMGFGNDYRKLEDFYVQTLIDVLQNITTYSSNYKKANKKHEFVVWQEVFDDKVKIDKETIVHVWKDPPKWQDEMSNVTKAGYRTILSSCWYLNYISYGADWQQYYKCDPQMFNGTDAQKQLVVGGETCMWGEYIDTTNVLVKMWPRASAVAERLWSDMSVNSTASAEPRLRGQRCRMVRRGIPAEPNLGPDFCLPEYHD